MSTLTTEELLQQLNGKLDAILEMNGNPYYDERGNLRLQCGNFEVFHGKGVIKFSVFLPRRDDNGFVSKDGAVFVEAAPAEGKRPDGLPNYNWKKKVTFSLGPADIAQLVDPSKDDNVKLIHKDQANSQNPKFDKSFSVQPPQGNYNTFNLNVEDRLEQIRIFVPMSPGQYVQFQRLLLGTLPLLIGWPR